MSSTTKYPVIYEDEQLLVLNKPSGVVVNISKTSPNDTVQNFLEEYLDFEGVEDSEFLNRAGLVHRLDKDTSGLLAVAKTPEVFYYLKNKFKSREVNKEYLAVVFGNVENKLIIVKAPIRRDPKNRMKMAILKDGRFALTNIELLETKNIEGLDFSLLSVKPLTGRTHQIRVHLSALNHPVIGDPIYLGKKRYGETSAIFGRLMLHAWKLQFEHPVTKKELNFEAPLPEQFFRIYSKHE